jgi:cob(I)alamin adenosyltransferase
MNLPEENIVFLQEIQKILFTIGSHLATDTTKTGYNPLSLMQDVFISDIEKEIDKIDENLSPLSHFVLPGGTPEAAQCHICRTVTRRAERRIVEMSNHYPVDERIIIYLNRLSDYFFALSRFIIKCQGKQEIYWK